MSIIPNSELNKQILEFCRHVAGPEKIIAIADVDNYSMKTKRDKTIIEIMLVIHGFQPRVMRYIKTVKEKTIFFFAVDQWIFERDIERGFLGEAIASKLIFPHSVIHGEDYLHEKEVELKKRLVLELLENLTSSFPELANQIQIKPQYFMYEVLLNRIRIFPLLVYELTNLINELTLNEVESLGTYNEALRQLETEGRIVFLDEYVKISKNFIAQCQDPKIKIINLSKNAPRTIFTSLFGVFPQLMHIISEYTETFLKTQKINWRKQLDTTCFTIDSRKYVFFPTSEGLVSLSDKIDIMAFAKKMLLRGKTEDVKVESIGGMLNDVYLIHVNSNEIETKVIAKRFRDWSGFKWFPLTLWSLGARSFAVSGQARLAKEYAISEFLLNQGFKVPKILHMSNAKRLIFMEYVEGENLSQAIKRIATATKQENVEGELAKIAQAGEILALVHSHDIALGDTKPENMLVKENGDIFMIDFEQATKGGDKAWDVAVFLYYSGHYIQPFYSNGKAESIAKAFITGYLRADGDIDVIRKAGLSKYTRIFSIFTMPSTIRAISNVCRKTEMLK